MEVVSERPWATVTREGDLFRKHCAPVQRYEVPLTVALAARWPDRVPEVVDHGDDWLLLRDAGAPIASLEPAMPLYAELQRGETECVDEHLAAGVPDLRAETLPVRYEAWCERDARLAPFAERFADLCASLTREPTVQHDDLTGSNVHEGPRILDWGDSSVGHPYFSLVATLRHVEDRGIARAFLDAWGGDEVTLALALRVGRIAHAFKQRPRDVPNDDWPRVVALAIDQTSE